MYPSIGEALVGERLGPVGDYITFRQKNVSQYTAMRPIYDIVLADERMLGSLELLRWWEQYGIRFGDMGGKTTSWIWL